MLRSKTMSLLAVAAAGAFRADGLDRARAGAIGPADHHRLRHGADRAARCQRQADLLGMKIWEEEINAKGGLLGRPVKLVF